MSVTEFETLLNQFRYTNPKYKNVVVLLNPDLSCELVFNSGRNLIPDKLFATMDLLIEFMADKIQTDREAGTDRYENPE